MKQCTRCKGQRPSSEFYRHKKVKSGLSSWCKECNRKYTSEWGKNHPEAIRKRSIAKRQKLREKVLELYGGKDPMCKCCGEPEIKFLCLDHINNDGSKERRKYGPQAIYKIAIRKKDVLRYQLLCFNCNMSKKISGQCPHLIHKNT